MGKPVKDRVGVGRVGKVNKERMRDFYSRRRGEARKLLLIPPTRCCEHFRNRYICKQPSINKANHLIWFQDSDLQANLTPTPIILADQEVKFNSVNARPVFNVCENIAQNARSIFNVRILHKIMSIEIWTFSGKK